MSVVDSNRERRENREQIRECLRKPLIHSQKGLPKGICPKSWATGVFSLSSILPPVVAQNLRKFVLVCFSMFASFALFAVYVSKRSVPCRFKAVQGRVQGEGFPSPPRWEPRAVKEEEALVRTLPVVRGSWNSKGVSVVNRGKKKGVSLVVTKRVGREGERSWEGKKSLLRGEESL